MTEYDHDKPKAPADPRRDLYRSDPANPNTDDIEPPETTLVVK
jgi:hypothetical protein